MQPIHTIGILGTGKLGVTLAQLALKAGYAVHIAGSGSPQKIALSMQVLAPGSVATTSDNVVRAADIVILALPLGKYKAIPVQAFHGKLVIDAMNYWWEVDGPREDFMDPNMSSSRAVQQLLSESRVVKGLNHMGYHDLHDEPRVAGADGRKAIAVAGDNADDVTVVSQLIDSLGFDPLPIGNLDSGVVLEPGHPAFGAKLSAQKLQSTIVQLQNKA